MYSRNPNSSGIYPYTTGISSVSKRNENQDYEIPNAASDSISKVAFCPTENFLASSCWDGTVRCWKIEPDTTQASVQAIPKIEYKHNAPALCCAVTHDGKVISGGCDNVAKIKPLPGVNLGVGNSNNEIDFGKHDAPIKEIFSSSRYNVIVTGSWDKTVKFWDARLSNTNPMGTINVPDRVYSMDLKEHLLLVACSPKHIVGIDLRNPSKIMYNTQSNLKYQTRTISIFPDLTGFIVGSVEGRCVIETFQKPGFGFKCHRDQNDNIYPVHHVEFHPYGTFCTCGGDGKFHFWDKESKQRVHQFKNAGAPVVSTSFNRTGTLLAYATSYDFACGPEPQYFDRSYGGHIYIHRVLDSESLPKSKR